MEKLPSADNLQDLRKDSQFSLLYKNLQICSEGLKQTNEAFNRIKFKSLSKDGSSVEHKSFVIFDSKTEEEDERVSLIIQNIRKLKLENLAETEKSIAEGKQKIDRAIKRKLKKKYLKF